MLKKNLQDEGDTHSQIHGHFSTSSPASLLSASAGYCQTALVGEPGMIRTQMKNHNTSVMVAVYGTLRTIPSRKQQQ
jgi:hypothetical protein